MVTAWLADTLPLLGRIRTPEGGWREEPELEPHPVSTKLRGGHAWSPSRKANAEDFQQEHVFFEDRDSVAEHRLQQLSGRASDAAGYMKQIIEVSTNDGMSAADKLRLHQAAAHAALGVLQSFPDPKAGTAAGTCSAPELGAASEDERPSSLEADAKGDHDVSEDCSDPQVAAAEEVPRVFMNGASPKDDDSLSRVDEGDESASALEEASIAANVEQDSQDKGADDDACSAGPGLRMLRVLGAHHFFNSGRSEGKGTMEVLSSGMPGTTSDNWRIGTTYSRGMPGMTSDNWRTGTTYSRGSSQDVEASLLSPGSQAGTARIREKETPDLPMTGRTEDTIISQLMGAAEEPHSVPMTGRSEDAIIEKLVGSIQQTPRLSVTGRSEDTVIANLVGSTGGTPPVSVTGRSDDTIIAQLAWAAEETPRAPGTARSDDAIITQFLSKSMDLDRSIRVCAQVEGRMAELGERLQAASSPRAVSPELESCCTQTEEEVSELESCCTKTEEPVQDSGDQVCDTSATDPVTDPDAFIGMGLTSDEDPVTDLDAAHADTDPINDPARFLVRSPKADKLMNSSAPASAGDAGAAEFFTFTNSCRDAATLYFDADIESSEDGADRSQVVRVDSVSESEHSSATLLLDQTTNANLDLGYDPSSSNDESSAYESDDTELNESISTLFSDKATEQSSTSRLNRYHSAVLSDAETLKSIDEFDELSETPRSIGPIEVKPSQILADECLNLPPWPVNDSPSHTASWSMRARYIAESTPRRNLFPDVTFADYYS